MRGSRGVLAVVGVLAAVAACTAAPPPLTSGLDLSGFDRSVRPQDSLFRFANGTWLSSTEIPADRASYGSFNILADRAEQDVREIAEQLDAAPDEPGTESQKIADMYAGFMDEELAQRLGVSPLAPELARIDALQTPADLVDHFGYRSTVGLPSPIRGGVGQDDRNADAYILFANQGGTTLPDRDYYLSDAAPYPMIRDRFGDYVTQLLTEAGIPGAEAAGARVLALETRLAQAQRTRVALRDPVANYNKFAVADAPGLDWRRYLGAAGIDTPELVIGQPDFVEGLRSALTEVPMQDWRSYLRFTLLDTYAPYLSAAFVDAAFEFNGKLLQGREEQRPRWKRAVAVVNSGLGEAVGSRYVERRFSPEAKQRMEALVDNLITAFGSSIDELDWMSEATKAEAHDKLARLNTKIGYPERWKDYAALQVRRDDVVGNVVRTAEFEHDRDVAKLGSPIDRGEWLLTPQTVNAYYNPSLNEIVFPAAILAPPFFDATADDAVNYGGIGAVIGHEISHGFDDQGRKYDGTGNLRDWWTTEDVQRFTDRTAGLVTQYSAYEPVPGTKINGDLTLGENIADLAGVDIAFEAYRTSLAGAQPAVMDGFTGEQRFFLGWAQVWRGKVRDEALRKQLLSDPHSPEEFRANGVVTNVPGFYEAFGVTGSDASFRPETERVALW